MDQYAPPSFQILPQGVKHLLIINTIFFLATYVCLHSINIDLTNYLALWPIGWHMFMPHQLITYMFMHGNLSHLFFNMFALWMFGYVLENYWGTKRFLIYYLLCGLGAGVACLFTGHPTVGASGAVYGILLAFGMMFPEQRIYLYFLVPIKAKWFVIIYGVIELMEGLFYTSDGVAHFAHLAGMLTGFIILTIWRKRTGYRRL